MPRSISEYGGCSVSTGAIAAIRRSWATVKFETPMCRTRPCSFSSASAAQPSSMSGSGLGQWIWYRSIASARSRFRLASASRQDRVPLQVVDDPPPRPLHQRRLGEHVRPPVHAFQRPPDDLLRAAEPVPGRGVDPVDAEVERPVDRRDGLLVVLRSPAEFPSAAADRPGAEADPGDLHAGRARVPWSPAVPCSMTSSPVCLAVLMHLLRFASPCSCICLRPDFYRN